MSDRIRSWLKTLLVTLNYILKTAKNYFLFKDVISCGQVLWCVNRCCRNTLPSSVVCDWELFLCIYKILFKFEKQFWYQILIKRKVNSVINKSERSMNLTCILSNITRTRSYEVSFYTCIIRSWYDMGATQYSYLHSFQLHNNCDTNKIYSKEMAVVNCQILMH